MSSKVKTRTGRVLIMPTVKEDAVITKAAMSDRDAKPLTDAQWEAVKPKLSRGRPRAAQPKIAISMRLDADVVEGMKSTGPRWQTKINKVMREWLMINVLAVKAGASKPLAQPKPRQIKAKKSAKTTKRDHEYAS
jgi:uncharacterized protein (DUF4415 family)